MAHLAKMIALASGCSHERAAVTLQTPSSATSTATTPSATVAVVKSPPPPDDDMVVHTPMHGQDPVGPPPPQHCVGVAPSVQATATMQRGPGGVFEVDLRITLASASGATFPRSVSKSPTQSVQAYGAVPVSATIGATNAVMRLRLNMLADKATVQLYLPLACGAGTGALSVFFSYDRVIGTAKVERVESR
jgi:hypothetical protein